VDRAVRADLREARQQGHVGEVARARLATVQGLLRPTIGTDPACDTDGPDAQGVPVFHGIPLTPPRLCPSCRLKHPAGTTCGWAAGPVGSQA
jgi:hypothetical protein